MLSATLTHLFLSAHPGATVALPVTASSVNERMAERLGSEILRTKSSPRAMMEAAQQDCVLFAGTNGHFILAAAKATKPMNILIEGSANYNANLNGMTQVNDQRTLVNTSQFQNQSIF